MFFGETRTPPLRPQMTSRLHTKDRDPLNVFCCKKWYAFFSRKPFNGTPISESYGSDASFSGLPAHWASRTRSQHHLSPLFHVQVPREFECTILRSAPSALAQGNRPY